MAWHFGKYTCGHSDRIQIVGPEKDRPAKAERHFDRQCPDCYRTNQSNQATTTAISEGWPALTGSPKQVAWAETIRHKYYKDVTSFVNGIRASKTNEAVLTILANWSDTINKLMTTSTESKWWINHNGDLGNPHLTPKTFIRAMKFLGFKILTIEEVCPDWADRQAAEKAQREADELDRQEAEMIRRQADETASAAENAQREAEVATVDASLSAVNVVTVDVMTREDWTATLTDARRVAGYIDCGEWNGYTVDGQSVRGPEINRITEQARQMSHAQS